MPVDKYEILNQRRALGDGKKRVGAYCRVSTDREDQANSFESQCRFFRQYIERNPNWELVEIFADEGLSGTSTKKRRAFNRMIACAQSGKLDLILTKEISRFARNTLDSIYYTRELKRRGVGVVFLNDNINTLDGDAELRLAIMASIAQEESRRTSERVKWGQKRRMEQGVVFGRSMLGYDVREGRMYVNEEGARVVRLIFRKFAEEGKGTYVIARELDEAGIRPMGGGRWKNTVILRILRNEKYCGDLVQKKTYTPDFLSHEKKTNLGQEEFVILREHHVPIVSRELFEKAGSLLDARALSQEGKRKYSRRYPFSGKIRCGRCGGSCAARYRTRKDGSVYKAWRCFEAAKNGSLHREPSGNQKGCPGTGIRGEEAEAVAELVCRQLIPGRAGSIAQLMKIIRNTISTDLTGDDMENSTEAEKAADTERSTEEGREERQRELTGNRMKRIRETVQALLSDSPYEEEFCAQLLEKLVLRDREHAEVYLKGISAPWHCSVLSEFEKGS